MKRIISDLARNTIDSIRRFFVTFCLIIGLFLVWSYRAIYDLTALFVSPNLLDILGRVLLVLMFGILFCTLGTVLYEKFHEKIRVKKIFVDIGLLIVTGLVYIPLMDFNNNAHIVNGYIGVMVALFMCIVYFSIKESISKTFSYMFKRTMFNILICGVVFGGMFLCIFAFDLLIFSFDWSMRWLIYTVTALFIWIVLFLNLSLSIIPKKDTEFSTPEAFKVIVMCIMLPTFLLLLILYVDLIRSVVTFDFSSGLINQIALYISLMFIFFILSLEQYRKESKFAELFVRFAGYIIIPIIVVQFWAIYIQVSAHGLTSMRYVSIALNIIALTFAIVSLIKSGRLVKYMLLVAAAVALVITLTPLNVIDVPVRNQTARLVSLLEENDMIVDGRVVAAAQREISFEDRLQITRAYRYIVNSDANRPPILADTEGRCFERVFGFEQEFVRGDFFGIMSPDSETTTRLGSFGCWRHSAPDCGHDVEGFSRFYKVQGSRDNNGSFRVETSIGIVNYDITNDIIGFYNIHGLRHDNCIDIYINEHKLIIRHVSFRICENGVLEVRSFSGYFLVR